MTRSSTQQKHFYISWVSHEMQIIEKMIMEISRTDLPVLITGESGVGKEVAAVQIHEHSDNGNLPFVKLSCLGFGTETFRGLLERIEKGLHGTNGDRIGTILLDEITELDSAAQRRVLQLIPENNGLKDSQPLAARIVCCTARDLEVEVRNGRFRAELFYRLNGVGLRLPPLRRLKEDIPALAQFFVAKYARLFHREEKPLSERAMGKLTDYPWPGNIRELENVIKRIVALDDEEPGICDLSNKPALAAPAASVDTTCSLKAAAKAASRQAERELILQALTRTHWNRKKAAKALQTSYKSLLYKLKQMELPDSEEM